MAISYPTSLDSLSNPNTTDALNSPSHAGQHSDANDAIEALQAKVGANSSAVETSHDYKLSAVTGSNKAETQGNKRTSFQATPTDTAYPTEKLVKDSLDLKAPLTAPTFANSITGSYLTASEVLITDADKKIVSAPVATYPSLTELAYVKGLTSSAQTQITAKTDKSTLTTQGDIYIASAASTPARLGIGTAGQVLTVNSGATAPEWAAPAGGGSDTALDPLSTDYLTFQHNIDYLTSTTATNSENNTNLAWFIYKGALKALSFVTNPGSLYFTIPPSNAGTSNTMRFDDIKRLIISQLMRIETGANWGWCGFVGTSSPGNFYENQDANVARAAFVWRNSESKLYAVNGTGAGNYNATEITGITVTNYNRYTLDYDKDGTSIKFYVNGVLKATHTTHFVSGITPLSVGFGCGGGGKYAFFSPYLISIKS